MRLIRDRADIEAGLARLLAIEPGFGAALACVGEVALRRKAGGFGDLLEIIVSQQVSLASAAAIKARMRTAGLWSARAIGAASEADLRAAGLSRPKLRYVRALAGAGLDFAALEAMEDGAVLEILCAIPGIGRWSGEIYLLQSLGRADVFPAGDLALQEAARRLFSLDARPSERALRARAEGWAGQRAIAARLLWAYYGAGKTAEGIG